MTRSEHRQFTAIRDQLDRMERMLTIFGTVVAVTALIILAILLSPKTAAGQEIGTAVITETMEVEK